MNGGVKASKTRKTRLENEDFGGAKNLEKCAELDTARPEAASRDELVALHAATATRETTEGDLRPCEALRIRYEPARTRRLRSGSPPHPSACLCESSRRSPRTLAGRSAPPARPPEVPSSLHLSPFFPPRIYSTEPEERKSEATWKRDGGLGDGGGARMRVGERNE